MPVIGFLTLGARDPSEPFLVALRAGLAETGFREGHNLFIDYRFADGDQNRLPNLAADLVRRKVAVIVAGGGAPSALAAKAATTTIPIVFSSVADAREEGLVATFNRPGGNATGISLLGIEIDPKRLELICEVMPSVSVVAVLRNPRRPNAEMQIASMRATASNLKRQLVVLEATTAAEIDAAFAALRDRGAAALVVLADPFFTSRRAQIVALAARHRIPAIYQWRDFAEVGGLMSYGPNLREAYHQAGIYTARILKGERPAEMPVLQPTKFEFVINAGTAKALRLTLNEAVLSRVDEVIE